MSGGRGGSAHILNMYTILLFSLSVVSLAETGEGGFLEYLEHIRDLECVPSLEQVLDNKKALTILTVLF